MVNDLTGKLSLNEMLRIFIPGIYFTTMVDITITPQLPLKFFISMQDSYHTILFIVFSLINGLLISSLDLPKKLWFFKNALPINQLKNDLSNSSRVIQEVAYFKFYDREISKEFKTKTELDSGYYHLCTNIAILAAGFVVICLLLYRGINEYVFLNFLFCILSSFSAATLFNNKVLKNFNRQKNQFEKSEEFKYLKEPS